MDIAKRVNDMGRKAAILGAWIVIASAASIVMNAGDAINGEGYAITRIVLGLFGLAAAALLWTGRHFGRDGLYAIMAWGALQIPYFAQTADRNYTKQLVDVFLGASSQTTVNGEVTSFSAVGINLVGVIILAWGYSCRERIDLWRRRSDVPATA